MSKTVKTNLSWGSQSFPAGTNPVDHVHIVLTGRTNGQTYAVDAAINASLAQVANVQADTYDITATNVDASGNTVGSSLSTSVVVPADATTVTLTVLTGISAFAV